MFLVKSPKIPEYRIQKNFISYNISKIKLQDHTNIYTCFWHQADVSYEVKNAFFRRALGRLFLLWLASLETISSIFSGKRYCASQTPALVTEYKGWTINNLGWGARRKNRKRIFFFLAMAHQTFSPRRAIKIFFSPERRHQKIFFLDFLRPPRSLMVDP